MDNNNVMDCLIYADQRLQEGYAQIRATGNCEYCEPVLEFMPIECIPTIINLFHLISNSSKSQADKVYTLETLSPDLSKIAKELGYLCKESK